MRQPRSNVAPARRFALARLQLHPVKLRHLSIRSKDAPDMTRTPTTSVTAIAHFANAAARAFAMGIPAMRLPLIHSLVR